MQTSFDRVFLLLFPVIFLPIFSGFSQTPLGIIHGSVKDSKGKPVPDLSVKLNNTGRGATTDASGQFRFRKVPVGAYVLTLSGVGFQTINQEIGVRANETTELSLTVGLATVELNQVEVNDTKITGQINQLADVEDAIIYAGKKNEVILLDNLTANTAQNNTRQILGKIPGMNIVETEGSGFPSNGIGFRGLNPTQSIEMNNRQNGYNITADTYGYPEVYYVPPTEALEKIEVVRGAASLQFGPQFGGMVNYVVKKGDRQRPFTFITQQTGGSFGLFNSFNAVGGTYRKFNYYAFVQYKSADGWRPNSLVHQVSGFARIEYQASAKLKLGLEYSLLRNQIQMPGGLTDEQCATDSRQSVRSRNWLSTPWNILAATLDYTFSPNTSLSVKSSFTSSERSLVWFDEPSDEPDLIDPTTQLYEPREVEREFFTNFTTEARLRTNYTLGNQKNTLVVGIRYFGGELHRQEDAKGTTSSNFDLTTTSAYEQNSEYETTNVAFFVENIFRLTDRFSVTPGFRYEFIRSTAEGEIEAEDGSEEELEHEEAKNRSIPLFGLGLQYRTGAATNLYANFSQAYRPIEYSFLTPIGVSSRIDPNLKDAKGYNADLGWRGNLFNFLAFDVGGFYIAYNNRIGLVSSTDTQGTPFTLRTNVANSMHKGIESYVECDFSRLLGLSAKAGNFRVFNSFAYVDARYVKGPFNGNQVEYAPRTINRFGLTYALKGFSTTFQWSSTAQAYGDANNTVTASESAIIGRIPAYQVLDWSAMLRVKRYNLKAGVNNLTDQRYFTRRTDEYPGPGIIPAIGRSVYLGVGANF